MSKWYALICLGVIVYFGFGLWATVFMVCEYRERGRELMGWQVRQVWLGWPWQAWKYYQRLKRGE